LLSDGGFCKNPHGSALTEKKSDILICPFDSCTSGVSGTRLTLPPDNKPRLRFHLAGQIRDDGLVVPAQWLLDNDSRLCPGCGVSVACLLGKCDGCTDLVSSAELPPAAECHGPNVFEVVKIVAKRGTKKKLEYLVAWKGFPDPKENTWQPVGSLSLCKKAIQEFECSPLNASLPNLLNSGGGSQGAKHSKTAIVPVNLPNLQGVAVGAGLDVCVSVPLSPLPSLLSFGVAPLGEARAGPGEGASVPPSQVSLSFSVPELNRTDTPKCTTEEAGEGKMGVKVCELPREKTVTVHTPTNPTLNVRQKRFVLSGLQEQGQSFQSQHNLQFAAFRQSLQQEAQGAKLGTGGIVLFRADDAKAALSGTGGRRGGAGCPRVSCVSENKLCLRERWDLERVQLLLDKLHVISPSHYDVRILQFVKDHADQDGFLTVHYKYAQGTSCGRLFSSGLSFQSCTVATRSFCSARFYVEDDLVNAFPTIMSQVFKQAGLSSPFLDDYVTRREEVFKEIETGALSRSDLKKLFLVSLHGGNYFHHIKRYVPFLDLFQRELKSCTRKLLDSKSYAHLKHLAGRKGIILEVQSP
jgi:hypothetical protein